MKLFKLLMVIISLLLSVQGFSQEQTKRLAVGDTVPDLEFKGLFNYPSMTARLQDFKGKAVILDFWNKGCSSCIASFPNLQAIQNKYQDDLVILLVNDQPKQTRESMESMFANSPILKSIKLPMVFGDANFGNKSERFPHWGVPFHVWIDKNGIIKATTNGSEATDENIRKLIKGEDLNVKIREDIIEGEKRDTKTNWLALNNAKYLNYILYFRNLQSNNNTQTSLDNVNHSLIMKDPNAGNLAGGGYSILTDSNENRLGSWNKGTIKSQFLKAYNAYLPIFIEGSYNLDMEAKYIYEFSNNNYNDSLYYKTYQEDLKQFFGYHAVITLRDWDCFILYRNDQKFNIKSNGGRSIYEDTKSDNGIIMQNVVMSTIAGHFRISQKDKFGNYIQIFDETGIDPLKKIDIKFKSSLHDLDALNLELNKCGLQIKSETRKLPVLVLKKSSKYFDELLSL